MLETAYETGLSGPSRLHDLFVTHEGMSPGDYKTRGAGLTIRYGFLISPFGLALVMVTDRGLAGLAFADPGKEREALADMTSRWPNANYVEDLAATAPYAARIFNPAEWRADRPLKVVTIGTDFQLRVWEALLKIPMGKCVAYSDIAADIGSPKASRAVGAAVGANPVSFVVPCHRAVGKSGALTGYHWGLTRKRAILGWEAGQLTGEAIKPRRVKLNFPTSPLWGGQDRRSGRGLSRIFFRKTPPVLAASLPTRGRVSVGALGRLFRHSHPSPKTPLTFQLLERLPLMHYLVHNRKFAS